MLCWNFLSYFVFLLSFSNIRFVSKNVAFYNIFYTYFYPLYLCGIKVFCSKNWAVFYIYLILFGVAVGVTVERFCVSGALCIWLKWTRDYLATANINSCGDIYKNSPLRNVCQYIFLTLCNILHSKNSKYMIYNIVYRDDVSLCMRAWKEILKKKKMKEKKCKIMSNNWKIYEILLYISSYHSWRIVVSNIYRP